MWPSEVYCACYGSLAILWNYNRAW